MNLKFARWIPQKIFCHICNCIFIHIHLHIEIYICICTYIYMFISICKYIYIYTCQIKKRRFFFCFCFSKRSQKRKSKTPGQTLPPSSLGFASESDDLQSLAAACCQKRPPESGKLAVNFSSTCFTPKTSLTVALKNGTNSYVFQVDQK